MKDVKRVKKTLFLKAAIIITMLGSMLYFRGADSASISVASSIVAVMVMITFIRLKNPEAYKKDERINKLAAYAGSWSWLVTFIVVTGLFWADYLELLSITTSDVISTVFFVMIVTVIGFRFYFMRKGDVK